MKVQGLGFECLAFEVSCVFGLQNLELGYVLSCSGVGREVAMKGPGGSLRWMSNPTRSASWLKLS